MEMAITRKRRRQRLRFLPTEELLERFKARYPYDMHRIYTIGYIQHYYGEVALRHALVSELAKFPVKKNFRRTKYEFSEKKGEQKL